jgi:glucose/arabinose dehydrogenase
MRVLRVLPIVLLLALGVAPAAAATTSMAATTSVEVVASGLDSPRHLAFGSRGDLFVAESGRGGRVPRAWAPRVQ